MANTQVIQLDGIISDVQNITLQTESSNTILQLGDRFDYAIDSAISFGSPTTIFIAYPDAVVSTLEFGISEIGSQFTIFGTSLVNEQTFGLPKINSRIFANSLVNEQTFGTAQLNSIIYANSVESEIVVSQPNIIPLIGASSISPTLVFGDFRVNMQIKDVPFPSIESTLVIPNPTMQRPIAPLSIAPTNNFGTATFIDNIHRLLVFKNDNISKVGENDAIVIAGGIRVNPASVISQNATSGSATLPNNPVGFISVNISGRDYLMPYYNA